MTSELKILKQISENKKASILLIAKQLKLGNDYIRYLSRELLRKGLVKQSKMRDQYEITRKGWGELDRTKKPIQVISHRKKSKKKIRLRDRKEKKKKAVAVFSKNIRPHIESRDRKITPAELEEKFPHKIVRAFKDLFRSKKDK